MKSLLVGLVASLATPASSTFVVQCYSRLFDQRLDPIVTPGKASGHVHLIVGGSGFNATMDYNSARASSCSTCNVREDLSNYWTPKLYFKAQNGSILTVPVIGDNQGGNMGGMAIYYLTRSGPDNDKLRAFPPGFRMLAGDPSKRKETDDFAGRAISYKCVGGEAPNAADIKGLPSMKCDQIRAQVTFPSCWDGKNLDSNDHKSHVVYPKDGNYDGGRCPSTHPIHFPTLFSEVYYDTKAFQSMWYGNKQPFVLANGDDTGYGYHGDFVNGWDEAVLQKAVTNCIDGTADCPGKTFKFREQGETQACKLAPMINEQVNGVLSALPGCNPVGAPPPATCNAPGLSPPTPESLGYVDLTKSKGFKYVGCGKDNAGKRTLTVAQTSGSTMTVETCVDFCKSKNTQYAGLVYGGECYCGNDVAADRAPVKGQLGNCLMKCTGNKKEVCGGPDAISLYQSCNGGTCTNLAKRESRRLAILESANANAMARQ